MNLRKPLLVAFASAIALVAINVVGVSSAAASTTEECHKEESGLIFTSQHFIDENCTKKSGVEGPFHTTAIKPTAVLTFKETPGPITIEATLVGVKTEFKCEKTMAKQTVSNIEGEKEAMSFKGTIPSLVLSSCIVSKPTGCTMKPIETVPLTVTSEDLPEEVQRTKFVPTTGTKFGTLTVEGCAVEGIFPITGILRSQTVDIHTEEFSAKSGSELVIGESPALPFATYCWVTEADNKLIVRELP